MWRSFVLEERLEHWSECLLFYLCKKTWKRGRSYVAGSEKSGGLDDLAGCINDRTSLLLLNFMFFSPC